MLYWQSVSRFFLLIEHIKQTEISVLCQCRFYLGLLRKHVSTMNTDYDLIRKKLVVIGNGNVGKTSLLYAFKDNRFCQDYVPTLFEGNTQIIDVDNKHIELLLIDTAGQEEYAR